MKKGKNILFKVEIIESEPKLVTTESSCVVKEFDTMTLIGKKGKNVNKKTITKHTPKYICLLCDKNCKSKVYYDSHQRSHEKKERKFLCPKCKEDYLNKGDLSVHMRSNHEILCKKCSHMSKSKQENEDHIGKHFVQKFLKEMIYFMCLTSIKASKQRRHFLLAMKAWKRNLKIRSMIERSKLLHKHQYIGELNRYDSSTDDENDDL